MEITEIFNTRELAFIIWLSLFAILILCNRGLRKDFLPIVPMLFQRNFLVVYLLSIGYITGSIVLLSHSNLWDRSMLKDSILWFLLAALPMMYDIARTKSVKVYFKTTLRELFTYTVILEFVLGLYTFNLWIELLIGFVVLFFGAFGIFLPKTPEYEKPHRIIKGINTGIAPILFLTELYQLILHSGEFWKVSYLKQFTMPIALALLFIPFLYGLVLFMRFEVAFQAIGLEIKPESLLRYTKRQLMLHFVFNLEGLGRWRIHYFRVHPKTELEISQSIRHILDSQQREKLKALVDINEGWSPHEAKDFLADHGLITDPYINYYGEEWGVTSNTKALDDGIISNGLVYGVTGNQYAVTRIKLRLQLFNPEQMLSAQLELTNMASVLYKKVMGVEMPVEVMSALLYAEDLETVVGKFSIKTFKVYYDAIMGGYDLKLYLTHEKHV